MTYYYHHDILNCSLANHSSHMLNMRSENILYSLAAAAFGVSFILSIGTAEGKQKSSV